MEKTCNFCGIAGSSESSIHDLNPDNYMDCRAKEIMIEKGCCFDCAFFFELIEKQKNNPNWIVIDGESWIFGPMAPKANISRDVVDDCNMPKSSMVLCL